MFFERCEIMARAVPMAVSFPDRLRMGLFPACAFTFTAVFWMILSFLPVHLENAGISNTLIGTVMGLYSVAALFIMLPLGMLSDRVSPKRILAFGALGVCGHILGLQAAARPWHFVVLAIVGGMGWAIFQIVLLALYLKVIDESRRGLKIALFQAGNFLGFGAGPLLAGIVWGDLEYTRMLNFAVVGSLVLCVLVLGLEDSPPIRFGWGDYRRDLWQKRTLLFLGVYFVYATHFGVEHTAYTLLMKKDFGFTNQAVGISYLAVGIWMAFLSPLAGHRIDVKQSVFRYLVAGLSLSAVFHMATAFGRTLPVLIPLRILHTLGDVPVILAMGVLTAAFFPQGRMGGNSAAVYTVRTIGVFAGNFAAGLMIPVAGYGGVFLWNGLFVLAATFCLAPMMKRHLLLRP